MSDKDNSKVELLAAKFWEALNEVECDPMHPKFENLDDPIKEGFLKMAYNALSL